MSLSVSLSAFNASPSAPATGKRASAMPAEQESVESQFLKIARQSPVERMRSAILKRMGLTEDDLKAMDPQARAAIEKTIREEIARQMKASEDKRLGLLADVKA